MEFSKVFRGYSPQQVEKYINQTAQKEAELRLQQKERIEQLLQENAQLSQQVEQYKKDELSISKTLVASKQLAEELKYDAQKYSDLVLSRAKIFHATWLAYFQTLIATLSDDEVTQFNAIRQKIETLIDAYEGKKVVDEAQMLANSVATSTSQRDECAEVDITPSVATMNLGKLSNPISKVEDASGQHVIDLRELLTPEESLEELCADLGLIKK